MWNYVPRMITATTLPFSLASDPLGGVLTAVFKFQVEYFPWAMEIKFQSVSASPFSHLQRGLMTPVPCIALQVFREREGDSRWRRNSHLFPWTCLSYFLCEMTV